MPDEQIPLAELNARFFRHSNPIAFGNEEEKAAAIEKEGGREAEELEKTRAHRKMLADSRQALLDRHMAQLKQTEVAPAPAPLMPEEQAALDQLFAAIKQAPKTKGK